MTKNSPLRIGTRRSKLAMWQAERVKEIILKVFPNYHCEIIPIETTGDLQLDKPISDIGGKGIFLKEIEQALVDDRIDIAVHSFKDITAIPNQDLIYSGFILEESVTDTFILFDEKSLTDTLTIGTGSLRRKALCAQLYPSIQCVDIRGNVHSRIQRAKEVGLDGLMLSTAGLERMNLTSLMTYECNPQEFIPAPGQGMIAIQQRANESDVHRIVTSITNTSTNYLAGLYYDILHAVNFNCGIPFGAYLDSNNTLNVFIEVKNTPHSFQIKNMSNRKIELLLNKMRALNAFSS